MKETDFINQNSSKWRELEQRLQSKKAISSHENLGESFVRLTEDLSYAQTYYPRRIVRVYLNGLAQRMYKKVFNARMQDRKGMLRFWTHELPTALWESRLELIIALVSFMLAVFIGVLSSRYDDGFATQILGSSYVNMTEENIAKGDPMGVYKGMDVFEMFFMILYNNLQVSVFTFVLGILFGLGTLGIIFRNGVMLGVFQYFFVQRGLGFDSFLTIWQHGTIEIASIVVAGAAGLVLGRSIVFPGTLPRSISLKFGFLKGLKILLGVAPLIFIAAFIESFYTRFDDLPIAFRLFTILVSVAFVIAYYIILPIRRGRKQSLLRDVEEDYSQSHVEYKIDHEKIKSNGEILGDSLVIIQQNLPHFMKSALWPAAIVSLLLVWPLREQFAQMFYFTPAVSDIFKQIGLTIGEVFARFGILVKISDFGAHIAMWPIMALALGWLLKEVAALYKTLLKPTKSRFVQPLRAWGLLSFIQLISLAPFFVTAWYGVLYILLLLPTTIVAWFIYMHGEMSITKAHSKALLTLLRWMGRHFGMIVITLFFSALVSMLVQSPVIYLCVELANGFIGFSENKAIYVVEYVIIFASMLTYFCGMSFIGITSIMNYCTVNEISTAQNLLEKIESIQPIKRGYAKR